MKPGVAILLAVLSLSCSTPEPKRTSSGSDSASTRLRQLILEEFPGALDDPSIPESSSQTVARVSLGEALFFDPNLSSCGTVACASCHIPEMGFSDGQRVSDGCAGATGRRNSNTIYNTAYLSHLFWDGRAQSLEEQALGPVVDPVEMANTWDNVVHYLSTGEHPVTGRNFPNSLAYYQKQFAQIFSGEITSTSVTHAIAAYERTVISRDSPFDRWLAGDESAMSSAQKKGAMVFFTRGRCSTCHSPPHFTDSDFHNVAVPQAGFEEPEMFPLNKLICKGIAEDADPGRAEIPALHSSCSDLGRFKTPTLRNVELTAPYMHNGRFLTIEDVLQHYWNLGRGTADPVVGTSDEKTHLIMLTSFGGHPEDITNLADFLKALTGTQAESPVRGIAPPED